MSKIYIRLASPEDHLSLIELNDKFNGVRRLPSEVKQSLMNTKEIIALAMLDEVPIGFGCAQYFNSFCYEEPLGEITELYVNEVARGRGLGTLLISFVEDRLTEYGVKSIKVVTSESNKRAIKTYLKAKYIQEDDLIFQKRLDDK
ncbi:GNAT family N-acetyltransferase [Cohnella terricola]|uniref:GNAT family N-acetyltransferase n=1 Tax=Cohnella terricola TaxID=1289167 RepID=UPI0016470102|nr:GNAT family N-acetyltransferase [Cohnella terricola]